MQTNVKLELTAVAGAGVGKVIPLHAVLKRLNRRIAPDRIKALRQSIAAANRWLVRDGTGRLICELRGVSQLENFARHHGVLRASDQIGVPTYRLAQSFSDATQAQHDFATTLVNLLDEFDAGTRKEILALAIAAAPALEPAIAELETV